MRATKDGLVVETRVATASRRFSMQALQCGMFAPTCYRAKWRLSGSRPEHWHLLACTALFIITQLTTTAVFFGWQTRRDSEHAERIK